jgi:hypothetical protein
LELDNRIPADGEKIYIPQHPGGADKVIAIYDSTIEGADNRCEVLSTSMGTCYNVPYASDIGYKCDTVGGSSGSPVISVNTNKVLALHHCGGGCGGNIGVPITEIYNDIVQYYSVVQSITPPPTPQTFAPCLQNQYMFRLELKTDDYGLETTWNLKNNQGGIIASNTAGYLSNELFIVEQCLDIGLHTFIIFDSNSDGICCSHGAGSVSVFYDDVLMGSASSFGSEYFVTFGIAAPPRPTSVPTPSPTASPAVGPTLGPTPGPTYSPTQAPRPAPPTTLTVDPPTHSPETSGKLNKNGLHHLLSFLKTSIASFAFLFN